MTTIVPEYHTTVKYEINTYIARPWIISDKDFFLFFCVANVLVDFLVNV